jgi:hypothetical protein
MLPYYFSLCMYVCVCVRACVCMWNILYFHVHEHTHTHSRAQTICDFLKQLVCYLPQIYTLELAKISHSVPVKMKIWHFISPSKTFHLHKRDGVDNSLARPGRKQATATKLGIYPTYSPWSSIHFLTRCSNFCKPPKKNSDRCPSNQVSATAMTSASDE